MCACAKMPPSSKTEYSYSLGQRHPAELFDPAVPHPTTRSGPIVPPRMLQHDVLRLHCNFTVLAILPCVDDLHKMSAKEFDWQLALVPAPGTSCFEYAVPWATRSEFEILSLNQRAQAIFHVTHAYDRAALRRMPGNAAT